MDYLVHYGIKGQTHGVRRFQNEDGSLTPAGKERYGRGHRINENGEFSGENPPHRGNSTAGIAKASAHLDLAKRRVDNNTEWRKTVHEIKGDESLKTRIHDNLLRLGELKDVKKAQIALEKEKALYGIKKTMRTIKNKNK